MNEEIYNDYLKLSGEITEKLDNTASYKNWLIIQEYIDILIKENQQLKEQYCERTDCSGRLGNSKKFKELEQENLQLKKRLQQKDEIINKAKEHLELKVIRYSNETNYTLDETDLKEIIQILNNKGE